MIKNPNKKIIPRSIPGFTLIELLVVISIFAILTMITIFNYGKFNSTLSIQNLADDIALTVRRAQGFAIGVRGFGGTFSEGYGINFTANLNSEAYKSSNKSFVLFADMDGKNKKYDYEDSTCGTPTSNNECIEILSIKSSDIIKAIYYNSKDDDHKISENGTVAILFYRPDPEPVFCIRDNSENSDCGSFGPISSIIVEISSLGKEDVTKLITISSNGQISVSN